MITKQLRFMEVGEQLEFDTKDLAAVRQAIFRLHSGPRVYSSRTAEDKVTVIRIR